MGDFFSAVLSFPAVVFTFMVLVVVGYWLLALLGGTDVELLDGDDDDAGGMLGGLGLGGVPATVALSVLIVLAWFLSLVGTVLLDGAGIAIRIVLFIGVVFLALLGTRLIVLPLRRLYPDAPEASRLDFVGRACVIRTGSVTPDFGQAEVTAADGSSAIVQVRQAGTPTLTSGASAVIYDYDADGEFFWVEPVDDHRKV